MLYQLSHPATPTTSRKQKIKNETHVFFLAGENILCQVYFKSAIGLQQQQKGGQVNILPFYVDHSSYLYEVQKVHFHFCELYQTLGKLKKEKVIIHQ